MVGNIVCAGQQQWGVFDELKIWSNGGEVPGHALRRGSFSLTPLVNWYSSDVEFGNWQSEWGTLRLTPNGSPSDPVPPGFEEWTCLPSAGTGPYLFSGDSAVISVKVTVPVSSVSLYYVAQDPVTEAVASN